VLLAGCASEIPSGAPPLGRPAQVRARIDRLLPPGITGRSGWTADIYAGFAAQGVEPTRENVCAVVAVIGQESGFQVDPVIPGLGRIARREIETRAGRSDVPRLLVQAALGLESSNGRNYGERIDSARTERQLSDVFEDFTSRVPLGRRLLAGWNPIRTRGPMQVNIAFAERYARARPYPWPVKGSIDDEVFTRRGGLYFGIAHLLGYSPPYDRYLYRFADFNAGQYASRNAAFQEAVTAVSGIPLVPDGALLALDAANGRPGNTERALQAIATRLGVSDGAIHSALEQERSGEFEQTMLYRQVFRLAGQIHGRPLPRARVPRIRLEGPKLERKLTTAWYAQRVNSRFSRCLKQQSR